MREGAQQFFDLLNRGPYKMVAMEVWQYSGPRIDVAALVASNKRLAWQHPKKPDCGNDDGCFYITYKAKGRPSDLDDDRLLYVVFDGDANTFSVGTI